MTPAELATVRAVVREELARAAARPRRGPRAPAEPGRHLVPVLVRLPPEVLAELHEIRERTRRRQADLLREGVGLLVARYRAPGEVADGG